MAADPTIVVWTLGAIATTGALLVSIGKKLWDSEKNTQNQLNAEKDSRVQAAEKRAEDSEAREREGLRVRDQIKTDFKQAVTAHRETIRVVASKVRGAPESTPPPSGEDEPTGSYYVAEEQSRAWTRAYEQGPSLNPAAEREEAERVRRARGQVHPETERELRKFTEHRSRQERVTPVDPLPLLPPRPYRGKLPSQKG